MHHEESADGGIVLVADACKLSMRLPCCFRLSTYVYVYVAVLF